MPAAIRNAIYFQQQIKALLKNQSNIILIILALNCLGFILSFSETLVKHLVVIPAFFAPGRTFGIWTIVTFCFIELHWWQLAIDILTLSLCSKLIEPSYGRKEVLKFFVIVNFGVAMLSMFFYLCLYASTRNSKFLFEVQIHGLSGFLASLLVAVRQILPDHLIFRSKWGFFTNR